MEGKNRLRSLIAGALVVAMLVAVPVVLTQLDGETTPAEGTPMLTFDGMHLSFDDAGNIQALVDVYIEDAARTSGYDFFLTYDADWLVPSDIGTNAVLGNGSSDFFEYNQYLLWVDNLETGATEYINPFGSGAGYSMSLDTSERQMSVQLDLDRDLLPQYFDPEKYTVHGSVVMDEGYIGENAEDTETYFYLAGEDGDADEVTTENIRIKLGTLSFRINDREKLREMIELTKTFDNNTKYWWNTTGENTERLPIFADTTVSGGTLGSGGYRNPWVVSYYNEDNSGVVFQREYRIPADGAARFIYNFGSELISAEPLRKEITINAYQAYTYEGHDRTAAYENLAIALGKYAPTVVATYADSKVRNFTLNWGAADVDDTDDSLDRIYDYTIYVPATGEYDGDEIADLAAGTLTLPAGYLLHTEPYESVTTADDGTTTAVTENRYSVWREMAENRTVYVPATGEFTETEIDDFVANPTTLPPGYKLHAEYVITQTTTTPADGTQATTTADTTYEYSVWKPVDSTDPDYTYNQKQGEYIATQYLYYETEDGETVSYPSPMEVHITVTPVEVESISAPGLSKEYTVAQATEKHTLGDLDLPNEVQINTKTVSGAASLYLSIGGSGEDLPEWTPKNYDTDIADTGDYMSGIMKDDAVSTDSNYADMHWPRPDDAGSQTYGEGDYTFLLKDKTQVLASDITRKYPWLTATENYDFSALRTVDNDAKNDYLVTHVSTTATDYALLGGTTDYTEDGLALVLGVARGADSAFDANAAFRIRTPNGVELPDVFYAGYTDIFNDNEDGSVSAVTHNTSVEFDEGQRSNATTIRLTPGITSENATASAENVALRADLRRMINLGGYFEISVCEDRTASSPKWSEYFPVYASPRANFYEEDKEYNFIGLNAGLINYSGAIADTLTLPEGDYYPVRLAPETITDAGGGTLSYEPNTLRDTAESYGVLTTYDGLTGEQPGRVYTFRVEKSQDPEDSFGVWDTESPDSLLDSSVLPYFGGSGVTITRYNTVGVNDFVDEMAYDAYGRVYNTKASDTKYEPVIRAEESDAEAPIESIRLIYEGESVLNVITETGADGRYDEVREVVFDSQQEGYTVRQSFVLTLVNDGTTDIDGIYIDSLTDALSGDPNDPNAYDPTGGNFIITDPPASFLAAGSKTTFTITYVYNLPAGENDTDLEYLDKLYVCSNTHPVGDDALCSFDARFIVTPNDVNRVTVIVMPPFLDDAGQEFFLGEAGVITGPDAYGDMDYSFASSMRVANTDVYIGAFPYDEYEVEAVLMVGEDGTLTDAGITAVTGEDNVYLFRMPPRNVTIYVIFNEPTISKLRPRELNVYAASNADDAADRSLRADTIKELWQKSFTMVEIENATDTEIDPTTGLNTDVLNNLELMAGGAAAERGYDASTLHYLVVLDEDETHVQAETILRQVIALSDKANTNDYARAALKAIGYAIDPTTGEPDYENLDITDIIVRMNVYSSTASGAPDSNNIETVYDSESDIGDDIADGKTTNASRGDTATETKHTSIVFEGPAQGERKWLVVSLLYSGDGTEREYYIELVRRPSHSVTMDYGNSPVGMIYNTDALVQLGADGEPILDASSERTLNADGQATYDYYVENRDFAGEGLALPYAFTRAGNDLTTAYSYNREAWIPYGMLYDPDSLTYTASYVEENDLDLDPHSLFVTLGEGFIDPGLVEVADSSMREIPAHRVRRYIRDVVLMNTDGVNEVERFSGATDANGDVVTVEIDLGTLADGAYIPAEDGWQATHVYEPFYYEYDGVDYIVYSVTGKIVYLTDENGDIVTGDDGEPKLDNDNMFFQYTPGKYFPLESPHTELVDAETIDALQQVMVDKPTDVVIRPGVYELVYEFRDFDSVDVDDEVLEPLSEVRKIIVLGPVGDVNADETAHNDATATAVSAVSDEQLIEKRVESALGYDAGFVGANAFKFRTADVNNDRNINNIDANELHAALGSIRQPYDPIYYKEHDEEVDR